MYEEILSIEVYLSEYVEKEELTFYAGFADDHKLQRPKYPQTGEQSPIPGDRSES